MKTTAMEMQFKNMATEALTLSHDIQPLLKGRSSEIQGSTLADLVALYFAGHNPDVRQESIELWIETMLSLIRPCELQIGAPWD